jgi:molecular chaperone GrpE
VTDEAHLDEGGTVELSPVRDRDLPEDPEQAVEVLTGELAQARQSAESYLDDLRRVAADFENFRKRAARDRDEIIERASQRLVASLLSVLDSFDAALGADQEPGQERVVAGLRNIQQQLLTVLRAEGLEPIDAAGSPFDPVLHEAVSGGGDGHLVVTAEARRGYTLNGRVLRPTLVEVAAEDVSGDEA